MTSFARRLVGAAATRSRRRDRGHTHGTRGRGRPGLSDAVHRPVLRGAGPTSRPRHPATFLEVRRADTWLVPGNEVWQIKYRSTNSSGDPIPAVTTVIKPINSPTDMPVLSYQAIVNTRSA